MAQCPECGAQNPDGAAFCSLCASPFRGEAPEAVTQLQRERWQVLEELDFKKRKRSRRLIWGASLLAAVVIAVLAVVFIGSHMEKGAEGQSEYASKYSGISFKYPSSWEKKDFAYLKTLNKGQDVNPNMGNEIVLMKRGGAIYRHLLVVSSTTSPYGDLAWNDIKNALYSGVQQGGPENRSDVTFINLALPASARANGIGAFYTVIPPMGPTLFQIEGLIVRGDIVYSFGLTTPLKGGGSDEGEARALFTELMQSITFK